MEIVSLGHAGLRLVGEDTTLVMDPWLSRSGAFLGAWHQLPANDCLPARATLDCDWVAVSHDHQDHLDRFALSRLPAKTHVLVPAYPSRRVARYIREAGVERVIEVPAWQRFDLGPGGAWLMFLPEQSPMCHDAAVLVHMDGISLLHCNDARLTVAQTRRAAMEVGGRLDVMALQTSGASWHPICYEYPQPVLERISAQKRRSKLLAVRSLVREIEPRIIVPFAGPPCFLDPSLRHHNRWIAEPGIFPDQEQTRAWFTHHLHGQRVETWLPGDRFDPHSGRRVPDPNWDGFSFAALGGYLDAYAEARKSQIDRVYLEFPDADDGLGERFAEHFARVGELSPYFLKRIAMTVRFEVEGPGGGRWDVHVGPDRVRVDLRGRERDVQHRFRVASRWLAPVVDGSIGWEDLFLSLRFSAWRDPDVYNDYLVGLLKHADAASLRAVEEYEVGCQDAEMVVVECDGRRYEIARFCPHAGEDLAHSSVIADGAIRCLGHNYEFDLETGICRNGECRPLSSRPLQSAVS